ncbi:response regulator transcription factor [Aliikangiella marina]|uniref:Response regulator transcription factor n=1 Tax=Aliikangiella marina TaxID=1712262 RepID=A0A545T6G4_9GAMM|nr:response regulator [Aliikangiella marina]TQV72820.1 response regulator transcription factor [Aliikangiella marina]
MAQILWVEDQFHWIDKFKPILENADLGDGENKNTLKIFKFVEAACQYIKATSQAADIVILDANMNGNDDAGFIVSRTLANQWPDTPVIYLSEYSGTGIEEKAFEMTTAQDFIAKHQENVEQVICWRIKALLRQRTMQARSNLSKSDETIVSGELKIDLTNWNVYWYDERLMNPKNNLRPLAPTPRKILRYLVEASPRPVSTMQMAELLANDGFTYANYRQHIRTLRQAFEQASLTKNKESFIEACKNNHGIVTFGDEGGYCWIK